jgi:tyrosyl-tRNA synthetase
VPLRSPLVEGGLGVVPLTIVAEYHDRDAASDAREYFESKFQRREVPQDVPVFRIAAELWICELLKQLGFAASTNEARRLVGQGAVRVDRRPSPTSIFTLSPASIASSKSASAASPASNRNT